MSSFGRVREENKIRSRYREACERHVVSFELDIPEDEKRKLFALNELVRKAGNDITGAMKRRICQLQRTKTYRALQKDYGWHSEHMAGLNKDSAEYKRLAKERRHTAARMNGMQKQFGITQTDVFALAAQVSKDCGIPSVLARTRAEDIWKGIEKILFSDGKALHFRKRGDLPAMRAKEAGRIIIPKMNAAGELVITMSGFEPMPLLISKKDRFLQEEYTALLRFMEHPEQEAEAVQHMEKTGEVLPVFRPCYCAIQCAEIRNRLRCFVQITVAAPSIPKKDRYGRPRLIPGKGRVANDIGTQSVAVVSEDSVELVNLGERVNGSADSCVPRKKHLLRGMDRSRKATNPDRFHPDGTYKRGSHDRWKKSKHYFRMERELKELYRREAATRLYANRELANHMRSLGDVLITEPSNSKALAKRSKKAERQENASVVRKENGTTQTVHKYKKKKRFGASIGRRSPAGYQAELKKKFGDGYREVPGRTYRASQYDFELDRYLRKKLSDRWHTLPDGKKVQRDLMSAFLLYCADGEIQAIDRKACFREFDRFYEKHQECVNDIRKNHLKIKNSGIKAA